MNYAVIGYPIKHTMSPLIHQTNFDALKNESTYTAQEVLAEDIKDIKKWIMDSELSGINVTVPHKETIMAHLDYIDPKAIKIGAVNTVHYKDGELHGYNTDVTGYIAAFNAAFGEKKERHILILGAGGAAKAVHRAHIDHGDIVTIVARRLESFATFKSDDFTGILTNDFTNRHYDAVINATPIGLNHEDVFETMGIDPSFIDDDTVGMDLIYNPKTTPFMTYFKHSINGLDMLVNQAMDAYKIWTGQTGDTKSVKDKLEKYMEES